MTWHCHCDFIMNFLANSYFILKNWQAKFFKMRYTRCQDKNYFQRCTQKEWKITFHGLLEISKIDKPGESIKSYFPAFLWISLYRIIAHAPRILHFKVLGMANLQYGINICQRHHWSHNDYIKSVTVFLNQSLVQDLHWSTKY